MGECVYCGRPAGLFARHHWDCHPRLIEDRRWCSERRIEERRQEAVGVWTDRRRVERRQPGDRRSGRDRRQALGRSVRA